MGDVSVKWMHSAMPGAPTLNGTAGSLVALLDAVLVNGWGSASVDSIVIASGVATVTRAAGHPFEVDMVSEISGAVVTGGAINGQHKITVVPGSTSYRFDATGIPDQTATGTITHKVAAVGWLKSYAATNLAAYKSPNVMSTGAYLRVDDTGTPSPQGVVVRGYEAMSDINTGTGPFPTVAQVSAPAWGKSNSADSTARVWMIVGDDRSFHVALAGDGGQNVSTWSFGDFSSFKSPDAYSAYLNCANAYTEVVSSTSNPYDLAYAGVTYGNAGPWVPRAYTGLGSSIRTSRVVWGPTAQTGEYSGRFTSPFLVYPNGPDNSMVTVPIEIVEPGPHRRGVIPGAYFVPQQVGSASTWRDKVPGSGALAGRTLITSQNAMGPMLIDISGPWR